MTADTKPPGTASHLGQDLLAGGGTFVREASALLDSAANATGLTPRVVANPYAMLATALGAGYVVGGGLFTPTTTRVLGVALRLAAIPIIRDRLIDLADAALDSVLPPSDPPRAP